MALPELDPAKRQEALAKAAEARRIRADVKQMLKAGEATLAQVLARADASEALGKMRVSEVLEALPHVGKIRSRRLMERLDIAPTRRLRGLGPRQREALLAEFEHE